MPSQRTLRTGAFALALTASTGVASPIILRFDMVADTEVNGVFRSHARTVVTMHASTDTVVETVDATGRRLAVPADATIEIENHPDTLATQFLRLFVYPDIGWIGTLTPFHHSPFGFLSHDAVGFSLDDDLAPIPMDNAHTNPVIVVQVSTGLLVFHSIHSGTFAATVMPSPASSTPMILAALTLTRRRRDPSSPIRMTGSGK